MPPTTKRKLDRIRMPELMEILPRDRQGRPVLAHTAWADDRPVRGQIRPGSLLQAHSARVCWLCWAPLEDLFGTFTLDARQLITRTSPVPPAHLECAEYSAEVYPPTTGPDVVFLYTTHDWVMVRDHKRFSFNRVARASWWMQGRLASFPEVRKALDAAAEILAEEAGRALYPDDALSVAQLQYAQALRIVGLT